jgi:hypothetical protein
MMQLMLAEDIKVIGLECGFLTTLCITKLVMENMKFVPECWKMMLNSFHAVIQTGQFYKIHELFGIITLSVRF